MTKILDFADALAKSATSGGKPSVLLGNGFSRGFSNEFAYARLRDVVPMSTLTISKDELFANAGSDDFETVILHLQRSARLLRLYSSTSASIAKRMEDDSDVVKHSLIDAITNVHPDSAWSIPDSKYAPARRFLGNFWAIFTLNYDLLLYWTVLQRQLPPPVVQKDSFGRPTAGAPLTWSPPSHAFSQQIFYLHGAVHLYVRNKRVRKLELANGNLLQQLQTNLNSGRYPLVVTEGSREDKEDRIARSAYLTYCHERLRTLKGDLFIHGVSMSANDAHIFDAVADKENRVRRVFVGLHGPSSPARNAVELQAKLLSDARKANGGRRLTVRFYDSNSASVWG